MADIKITDLVDEKVFEDLEKLSENIKTVKQQYVEAARELAQGLNMKISTSGDLEKFNGAVAESSRKAQQATEQLNTTIDRQREIIVQTTNTISRELAEIEKENKEKRAAFEQDKSAIDLAERLIGSRQNNIIALARMQGELKQVTDAQKALDTAVKNGTISEQDAVSKRVRLIEQQRDLKAGIKDLNLVLTNQEKQMQASDGSYQKLSLQLEFLKKAYKGLSEEEKNSDIGKTLGAEIGNLDAHLKDLAADMGEFQRNTGNYAIANQSVKTELRELVQEIATLTLQYRGMSEEEQKSAAGQELEQKMNSLKARASELKDAVADVNREIQSGANDTKNFSAITEGINLLVSGIGGLTAASHALGVGENDLIRIQTTLQASLAASNALTKAQNVLQQESNLMKGVARMQEYAHAAAIKIKTAAEGESVIVTKAATVAQAAFNAVAKANPYVLLATGIGLLVAAVFAFTKATKSETEEQKKAREEMERSKKEYEEMMDTTEQLRKAREKGIETCSDEITKLQVLYNAATDVTRSYNERKLAVDKMQELYPSYMSNFSDEEIMAGKAADEYNRLREAIINKAIAEAKQDLIKKYAKEYVDSLEKIRIAQQELNKYIVSDELSQALKKDEQVRTEHGKKVLSIEEYEIQESNKRQKSRYDREANVRKDVLSAEIKDVQKQADDYKKAMEDIAKSINVEDLYNTIGKISPGSGSNTSKEAKETTTKTYEEIKEVILEYTQEIIAERIALTKEGSEEEYNLTIGYIENEMQLRRIEIEKGYKKEKEKIEKALKEQKEVLDKSLSDKKISQEKHDAEIQKYEDQLAELETARKNKTDLAEKSALKAKEDAQKKYTDAVIASVQEMYAKEQDERNLNLMRELTALTKQRSEKIISEEEYQKQMEEIQQKYAEETAQKQIEMLEKVLKMEELTAKQREKISKELKDAKVKYAKDVADAELKNIKKTEKEDEKSKKKREKDAKQYLRTISRMIGQLNSLVSAIYDGQIQKIEEEKEESEKAYEKEIEQIENLEETGAISKEEAEARKRAAEQRSAEKQEELDKKKKDIQYKQAVWEKATSIAQAGIATALAITEALPNIVLAALVGAMGAMEIATIIATPIATYAKGTGKDGHPGGLAIVGDAGKREAVVFENKMWITPDTPTLVDMPKGSVVYPDADKIPDPVFMTITPSDSKDSPIVIVHHDSKKLERSVAQTNTLIKQSIIMQKRIANDVAFQNYKRTRL
ncbi:MAG: hypothetical protein IJR69_06670 [Bacteroidaceae bacterium]|nr:hypothetical protein [Bacteroidaceae bacterium]